METVQIKLTVLFDGTFWNGIFERIVDERQETGCFFMEKGIYKTILLSVGCRTRVGKKLKKGGGCCSVIANDSNGNEIRIYT